MLELGSIGSANTKTPYMVFFLNFFEIYCAKLKSRYFKPIEKMLSIPTKVLTNEKIIQGLIVSHGNLSRPKCPKHAVCL